jgi:hypothetical protein
MRTRTRLTLLAAALTSLALSLVLPGSGAGRAQRPDDATRASAVTVRLVTGAPQAAPARTAVVEPASPRVEPRGNDEPAAPSADAAAAVTQSDEQAQPDDPHTTSGATTELLFAERAGDPEPEEARAASTSAPCPKATTCKSYVLQPARWLTDSSGATTIKWRFNDAGRRKLRAPAGLLESALKSGMAEWQRWNSNVRFAYSGTTTAVFGAKGSDGSCDDGTNVIGWARLDPGVIAEVMTCVDKTGRRVVDADLALNVTFHWEDIHGEPESRHSYDIRSIVTHELGHIVSLGDLYSDDALYQTMMGNAKYGETRKRTLALGDVIGLQTAYTCGDGDTCPRKGIADD